MGLCCWHGRCDTHSSQEHVGLRHVRRCRLQTDPPSSSSCCAARPRLCLAHRLSSSQWSSRCAASIGPRWLLLVSTCPLRVVETMRCGSSEPHSCLIRHCVTVTSGASERRTFLLPFFPFLFLLWVSVRVGRDPALKTPAQIVLRRCSLVSFHHCCIEHARTRRCGTRETWHSDW